MLALAPGATAPLLSPLAITEPPSQRLNPEPSIGVWHGVAMDSLKYHPGPSCPTLLRPVGPYSHFRGGLLAERVTYGCLLPLWKPRAVRLCNLEPSLGTKKNRISYFGDSHSSFRRLRKLPPL
jgi:hypothetical protein